MTRREQRAELAGRAPSLARSLLAASILPFLFVGLIVWLGAEYRRAETVRTQARASFDRRIDAITLLSRMKDAETSQRGFVITGSPAFLLPYAPARAAIETTLAAGRPRAFDAAQARRLAMLRALTARKLAEMDRIIAIRRTRGLDAAAQAVSSGLGERLMDRMRAVAGEMIAAEEALGKRQVAAYTERSRLTRDLAWMMLAALSILLMIGLTALVRLRQARHAAKVEAFEAAERNRTILDSTIDALLILNPSGTIETMNAAATSMLGYAENELSRRDVAVLLDIAPGNGSFHTRVGLVDGQLRASFFADRAVRHRDGRLIPVDVAMGVMSLPSGDHIVASLRDISERKRIERMKDDLMSTVSHELRTPLTSVVGALGLLRAGSAGALPDAARRLIEIAENNSRRLIRLINDMLDIDRIESGKLHVARDPIDLCDVVARACEGSEGLGAAAGVRIECRLPNAAVIVAGDADRLLQVVTNLVSNAVRASPQGKAVTIGLAVTAAGKALVTVDDEGPGIPPAFRERIFGRFERAERDDGSVGTGLGLAISREIVSRHDGTIWFEDRSGGGTRFAFSIDLRRSAGTDVLGDTRLLICEDDDAIAEILEAFVAEEGYASERVASAEEARAALAARSYSALLLDLKLPGEGGLSLARTLRDQVPPVSLPIIIVSASAPETIGGGATPLDIVDWIEKPLEPERFAAALRTALGRSGSKRPTILHLDDDQDVLDVVAAGLQPEARILKATDLGTARHLLQTESPDVAILDLQLADGSGLDLLPMLVGADGLAIPTIVYSAQDISAEAAQRVDAVLVKARGSLPDLAATVRRVVRQRELQ
ncbi:ATP-binding protein [Sphingomonas profundi]|uniref:ATP-binding protein n=1 Tax=Alterirhizorhabdus profundi TaxID=2681549 RepID=UPI0012E9480E|nr:ATP-binding protein [Sphingomonas profundi]